MVDIRSIVRYIFKAWEILSFLVKYVGQYAEIKVQSTAYEHRPEFWHIRIALRNQICQRRLHG
jgi:hypothetical protein